MPDDVVTDDIGAAVEAADVRVLLMALVHNTGDLAWLERPYLPARDVRLIPDPSAGLPPEIQRRIRAAALDLLRAPARGVALPDPGDDLMRRMMSVCLGEDVPIEYAKLTREEMGLVSRDVAWRRPSARPPRGMRVLIVGAGVCGIALGARLGRLGIPYGIVEKNPQLGGTWHENRYPGCGVDTPNHSYSFSFGGRHRWSRYFSRRDEIQEYLENVAGEFEVTENVSFETRLVGARWDQDRRLWVAEIERDGAREVAEAEILVSAIGHFNDPADPMVPGAAGFGGELVHSARWPADLDLAGKRVAVIGTGASAMQLVPTIAGLAGSITVYQRSPQWVRPVAGYADLIGEGTHWLLEHLPFYAEWFRFNMFWRYGDGLLPLLRKDPAWPHPARAINRANDRHREEMVAYIRAELAERPDLIEKCIPSYPPFGKRILLDNGWYRAIARRDVELVTEPIVRIDATGVLAADGSHRDADVIVLATGFKMTGMAGRLGIVGRGGRALSDAWEGDNPAAYLGMTVPGFPNFFCLLGPNTGLGHGGSTMFQAECQARYVTGCLVQMSERGISAIDVRRDVHDAYVRRVDSEHERLIWTHPGMNTYYRNDRGRVFSVMPWRLVDYWAMTHDPDLDDFSLDHPPGDDPGAEERRMAS